MISEAFIVFIISADFSSIALKTSSVSVPEIKKIFCGFANLLVLNKMKEIYAEEKESKLVLQRNLTLKELGFLREEGIKIFFGDFEAFDEEVILSDFEDKVYLLDYDSEKSFLYAQAFRFTVEESYSNSFVS